MATDYHHHLALVQTKEVVDEPRQWHILNTHVGINHIALAYADRDEFLARVKFCRMPASSSSNAATTE